MKYYLSDVADTLKELDAAEEGLTGAQAGERLAKYGPNRLVQAKKKSLIRRLLEQLADPMTLILIAAAIVSGITTLLEHEFPTDVIIIMAVVIINAVLGVYQEGKAEKAIEALQALSAATSKVLRDGRVEVIKSEELVPGDIIVLEAGDAVPAVHTVYRRLTHLFAVYAAFVALYHRIERIALSVDLMRNNIKIKVLKCLFRICNSYCCHKL